MKTDFQVAPVYLKGTSRVQALLSPIFLVLAKSLLEHELCRAMDREAIENLSLYPEGPNYRHPIDRRLIDLFENVQRHLLRVRRRSPVVFTTQLSRLQRRVLCLLDMLKKCNDA